MGADGLDGVTLRVMALGASGNVRWYRPLVHFWSIAPVGRMDGETQLSPSVFAGGGNRAYAGNKATGY